MTLPPLWMSVAVDANPVGVCIPTPERTKRPPIGAGWSGWVTAGVATAMDGTVAGASAATAAAGRRVASIGQKFASSGYELPHEGQTLIRDPSLGNCRNCIVLSADVQNRIRRRASSRAPSSQAPSSPSRGRGAGGRGLAGLADARRTAPSPTASSDAPPRSCACAHGSCACAFALVPRRHRIRGHFRVLLVKG